MPEPLVSALVAAYDAEPFVAEALESALAQDWPADRLEIIVVDDGSTDGTATVVAGLAARHPGRIRLIRQANAGACGATNTALAAARGELIALLDADDAWPAGKLRAQTAVLAARPEVGLVYGDMRIVDARGRVLHESFLEGQRPPRGRCLGELLESNDATASSLLLRRELAAPIPDGVPYTDWWFAARAARRSQIAYLAEPRTLYRFHGANLTLGAEGAARRRELRKAIAFRRWFLRRLAPGELTARELAGVWRAIEINAGELAGDVYGEAQRDEAAAALAEGSALLRRGEAERAAGALSRALACDPGDDAIRQALVAALAAAPGGATRPGQEPLRGAAEHVVLAYAAELLEQPALLEGYVTAMAGEAGVTLAIDASEMDAAAAEVALGALVDSVAGAGELDLLAVLGPLDATGQARLAAGVHAVLSRRPCELAAPRL
jgi:glycosyltransferase involved in cell wall biosynthesis